MAKSQLDNATQRKLEQLFDMSGGYVLDFSNASFARFVDTCLGFDPYDRYNGSKAVILRRIWLEEPIAQVARLNLELLEHWHLNKLAAGDALTPFEEQAYADLTGVFSPDAGVAPPASLDFLEQDLGEIDLSALPRELTSRAILQSRLNEIERCLDAEAPLAVVFLVGSTLEGLLMELAKAHPQRYTSSQSAPMHRGRPKPLEEWTLAELIVVSRALGLLGEDVLKHADHVRSFRNYIHPRQQLRERFEPRMITAQIAQQVLLAALSDLRNASDLGRQGDIE